MKVLISGPRSHMTSEDRGLPYLHLTVDMPYLPREGEHITLNGGTGFTVIRRMWWVTGPENEAYWARGDYAEAGEFEAVHLDVEPDGYRDETYTMDGARREGYLKGRQDALTELRGMTDLAAAAGFSKLDLIVAWLDKKMEETTP